MSLKIMTPNEQAAQRLLEINRELIQIATDLVASSKENKPTRKPEPFAFEATTKKYKKK